MARSNVSSQTSSVRRSGPRRGDRLGSAGIVASAFQSPEQRATFIRSFSSWC
jgi:hypothetical protein